jgi:hypothetical protein
MQSAILYGLNENASFISQQIPATCVSGNCKWADFLSLAVCSSCVDVSHAMMKGWVEDFTISSYWPNANEAAIGFNMTSYNLSNGLTIYNPEDPAQAIYAQPIFMTARSTARPSETIAFQTSSTLFLGVSILRAHYKSSTQPWSQVNVTATDCALYFCVKRFTSTMENSTLSESSVEVASARNPASFQLDAPGLKSRSKVDALFEADIWFNRTDLQIDVPLHDHTPATFAAANISQPAIDGITAYISGIFNDSSWASAFPWGPNGTQRLTGVVEGIFNTTVMSRYAPPVMQQLWESSDLDTLFGNLAASITSNMRANSDGSLKVQGQLGTLETYIEVRWLWLILPVLCICLGAVSLLLAIWHTHKSHVPLWKNSALALLFHGLDYEALRSQTSERLLSQMQKKAGDMQVTFGDELAFGMAIRKPR